MINNLSDIVIQTLPGLANLTAFELERLGYNGFQVGKKEIILTGSLHDCMKLNLHLRTASRVLLKIQDFKCADPKSLYEQVKTIHWEEYLFRDCYLSVDSFVRHPTIKDARFANLKVKDGIVDHFYELYGRRPDSGKEKTGVVIFLYWMDQSASLYFDTSGQTIARHGYRISTTKAPLIEALAAALVLSTNWDSTRPFVNPMCGSGTLAIEAAMIATNTPPGLLRKNFGFMHLKMFENQEWNQLVREAKRQVRKVPSPEIYASDVDPAVIKAAEYNALESGMDPYINFSVNDFKKIQMPGKPGVILINPPYGERMGEIQNLVAMYRQIGDFLKNRCTGYTGYVFTGNPDLARSIGLKPNRRMEFYNGKIDCRLLEYDLYEGAGV